MGMSFSFDSQSEARRSRLKNLTLAGFLFFTILTFATWTLYSPLEPSSLSVTPQPTVPPTEESIMSKAISAAEVEKHKSADSAWVIIEGNVYDVTEFLEDHPGGKKVLLNACGQDSTEKFWQFHPKKVLEKTAKQFLKGPVQVDSKL
ncbi:hypothetical protein JCM16303_001781 [Sporobolomyces ruberrimus]